METQVASDVDGYPLFSTPEDIQERARVRRQEEQNHKEALDLVLICAQDIVDAWPKMTMRTLADMTKRMDTLRQALEAAKI